MRTLFVALSLGRHIDDYTFFSYNVNEALHCVGARTQHDIDCFAKIKFELEHAVDKHSKTLIATNIELFLNYCVTILRSSVHHTRQCKQRNS